MRPAAPSSFPSATGRQLSTGEGAEKAVRKQRLKGTVTWKAFAHPLGNKKLKSRNEQRRDLGKPVLQ